MKNNYKKNTFSRSFLMLCLLFVFSCSRNSECFRRAPDLVEVEVPALGIVGEIVTIKVKYKQLYSDDRIGIAKQFSNGNGIDFILTVHSCNGYKMPINQEQEIHFKLGEVGDYTLVFTSADGEDIRKEITIE